MALTKIKSGGVSSSIALDSPDINTPDIDGGTIDGTVIGGNTAAAISGTTGQFGTSLNVDGTATVDGLTVDGNNSYTSNIKFTHGATNYYSDWGYASDGNKVYLKIADGSSSKSVFSANYNGDISFYEDTGTTPKLFWDASAESLGIGTSSPSFDLDILDTSTASNTGAGVNITHATQPQLRFSQTTGNYRMYVGMRTNDLIIANDSGAEKVRFEQNGNVGIGTDYINSTLSVGSTDTGATITSGGSNTHLQLKAMGSAGVLIFGAGGVSNGTAGTERMRIDSSGVLMLGRTDKTLNADTGFAFYPNGAAYMERSNDATIIANRKGSSGGIIELSKDGTTVGSIGNSGGNLTVNSASTGLLQTAGVNRYSWDTDQFYPAVDNNKNLGFPSLRFKDLYLSGGVYLGGTGAANKLSDVETGTFTPFLDSSSTDPSLSYATQVGAYEKIGALVHASFFMNVSAVNSQGSGTLRIAGLPFNASSNINASEVPAVMLQTEPFNAGDGAGYQQFARTQGNSNVLLMGYKTGTGGASIPAGAHAVGTGYLIGHIVYRTLS